MCLFVSIRCFIVNLPLKFRKIMTIHLIKDKLPLIIYDSQSNKVILNNIGNKIYNKSNDDDGNNTSVRRNVDPRIPISPGFKSLCKMNFVNLV